MENISLSLGMKNSIEFIVHQACSSPNAFQMKRFLDFHEGYSWNSSKVWQDAEELNANEREIERQDVRYLYCSLHGGQETVFCWVPVL
jgi:hypothetical protein